MKCATKCAEHSPSEYHSIGGDSIGWWEGDTLVVETTNFLDSQSDPRDGLKVIDIDDLLYEYACHEGNYAMGNILRGARLLEEEYYEKNAETASTGSGRGRQ